jgi:hypothetical protein
VHNGSQIYTVLNLNFIKMENIKIIETLSDGTQKELCISDVINLFLYEKTKEYVGDTVFFSFLCGGKCISSV